MIKKISLLTFAFAIAIATVPMFAAFEAHVINVTATIENALQVNTEPIEFGTVFPEEVLLRGLTLGMSSSFLTESDADDVEYVIKQKPKCFNGEEYGRVTEQDILAPTGEVIGTEFVCADGDGYDILPVLCPFLSKHPDESPPNDSEGIDAFHGGTDEWTPEDTEDTAVWGRIAKSDQDESDDWVIDLVVPCFEGACAQDNFIPEDYQLDPILEHELFGCDLWIEVTGVSRFSDPT